MEKKRVSIEYRPNHDMKYPSDASFVGWFLFTVGGSAAILLSYASYILNHMH